jgi:hypothetical protein
MIEIINPLLSSKILFKRRLKFSTIFHQQRIYQNNSWINKCKIYSQQGTSRNYSDSTQTKHQNFYGLVKNLAAMQSIFISSLSHLSDVTYLNTLLLGTENGGTSSVKQRATRL